MRILQRIRRVRDLVRQDLYRYIGRTSLGSFLSTYITTPGFNFGVWFRICSEFDAAPMKYLLLKKRIRFGIDIYPGTRIGRGFYIGHFGGIVVSSRAVIGENCNISQGVTIGMMSRGKRKGYPEIGDRVYIGPGAKVLGRVTVGNDAAIAANCVVIDDVPAGGVVVGIPGRVVSLEGAGEYIANPVFGAKARSSFASEGTAV